MSKSVAQIEAELAIAKAAQAAEREQAEEKELAAKTRRRRIEALQDQIATENASIAHLLGKVDVRKQNIAALQQEIDAIGATV